MRKPSPSFILGFVLALIVIPPLQAQTPANPPADAQAQAANPAPAAQAPTGQAPDEMTRKIADLVHAGKYTEAQQLTTGLLVAYPDDQRLIKAKALLETLLAPAGPATATPGSTQPANNGASAQPATKTNSEQLTGMERVDYDALIELGRQAQQNTDLEQQKALLKKFMDESKPFLQKHPDEMLVWQLRAASAISLNDPLAGYEAGQRLLAADSNDPNLRRLLAQLKNKDWLDKQRAENAEEQKNTISVTFTGEGMARHSGRDVQFILSKDIGSGVIALLQSRFPHTNVRIDTADAGHPGLRVTINLHDTNWDHHCGFFTCDAFVNSQLLVSVASPAGSVVDRTFELHIKRSETTTYTSVRHFAAALPDWIGQEVMEKLKVVLDEDAVRTSMRNPNPLHK